MRIALKPLAEQVILVTGASSGIGLVTAKLAAARGARVMLVARNEASLREAVETIVAAGGEAAYTMADVGDMDAVRAAGDAAVARWGRIDTWANVAGTAIYARLVDTPLDEHQQLFRTNYFGTVHAALVAHKHLRAAGGAFIAVGSIASDLPSPILSAYAASKHAVKGFVDGLRMEFSADKVPIAVTLIKPSGIDTPIAQHAANHIEGEALIPAPVYDPTLVAEAILHAAQHVRREITVGGAGALQTIVGVHFPALLDRLSGLLVGTMVDPKQPRTVATSIFAPEQRGQERSGRQAGRRVSFFTAAELRPAATVGAIAGVAALGALAVTGRLRRRLQ